MRFALLGEHPDGLEMARALTASGRHEIAVYSGGGLGMEYLQRYGIQPRRVGDLEEVLADPAIEAVIVAGGPAQRPGQLRRALQSERQVLCVHPADDSPDLAYEAAMLQTDARVRLLPLLPEALHPAIRRFAQLARPLPASGMGQSPGESRVSEAITAQPLPSQTAIAEVVDTLDIKKASGGHGPLSARLLEIERWSSEDVLLDADQLGNKPGFPGWDTLRLLGGDIAELLAFATPDEAVPGEPLLLAGRFVQGGLFQATYLPGQSEARLRLALVTAQGRTELVFPDGYPGEAFLTYVDEQGQPREEHWGALDPWALLVEEFERQQRREWGRRLTWQDEVRALELDDAARRSVERRRASTLDFQEATEEASFKGAMTLVGCTMVWVSLVFLILSIWVPWLGYLILPVFGIFLVMQLLRGLVRPKDADASKAAPGGK